MYGGVCVKYLLWVGKSGLVLFWLVFLLARKQPLAEPFASLLGIVAVSLLGVNLLSLLFCARTAQSGHALWLERLQLLLFGAFHCRVPLVGSGASNDPGASLEPSDVQAVGSQADQKQAD